MPTSNSPSSSPSPTNISQKLEGSRPATAGASTRIDLRTLASLALFWEQKHQHLRSQSELIRTSLETFLQLLVINGEVTPVESHDEALEILKRRGLSGAIRLTRKYLENLSTEALGALNLPTAEEDSEAVARREQELQEMKRQLAVTPDSPQTK